MNNLVTGATGLLGSHIVERLVRDGERVRCLVRKTSDTDFLDTLDIEKVYGDIRDPDSLGAAFKGIDVVYHCAAKVTDWGPWEEFEKTIVQGTKNCLEASLQAEVKRFLYVSTEGVYGYHLRHPRPIDEMTPFAKGVNRWDYYGRSKILAEELVWRFAHAKGMSVTVIRPGWIYGPRANFPFNRAIRLVLSPLTVLIDGGTNLLNLVHAEDVADAAVFAAGQEIANNQAYNVHNDEKVTAKQFFDKIAPLIVRGKSVNRSIHYSMAYAFAALLEIWGRLRGEATPPLLTRYAVVGVSCNNIFDAEKAKRELGWYARISFEDGIRGAIEWCLRTPGKKRTRGIMGDHYEIIQR